MSDDWMKKGIPVHLLPHLGEPANTPAPADGVPRPLTPEELEVCEAILKGETPRVAYRRITGHSSQDALQRFMRNPEALVYMAARRAEIREKIGADDPAEEWVKFVQHAAYWDPADVVLEKLAGPEDIANLPEHVRKLITGWGYDKAGHFIVKFMDREGALVMLARYWGLYQADRVNERDNPEALLRSVFWRYVIALHLHEGLSIMEAQVRARTDPDAVKAFAQEHRLLPPGKE